MKGKYKPNQRKKINRINSLGVITYKSISYFFFLLLFFLVSCNSSSSSSVPDEVPPDDINISAGDFSISTTSVSKRIGYSDTSYGSITLNEGVTATFSIVNSTVPDDGVSVASDGTITVSLAIPEGDYTFQVELTGTGQYTGTTTTETLNLSVANNPINPSDFNVSTTRETKVFNYIDTSYGRVNLNSEITATFSIVNSSVPNNGVSVDSDGTITVSLNLDAEIYTFQVQVTGTGDYQGSENTETLTLEITPKPISANDFNVIITEATKTFGYVNTSYGRVNITSGASTSFSIINSDVPNDGVSVDANGIITISDNVPTGTYTFQVQVTGIVNYSGSEDSEVLTLEINRKAITANDFRVSTTRVDKRSGYDDTSYGTITLNERVTATFRVVSSSAPNDAIRVANDGTISVSLNIPEGDYTFQVELTGTDNYSGTINTETLTLSVATNPITDNDFDISITDGTKTFGYTDTSYGKVNLGSGVTATFSIVNINVPNDGVDVSSDGTITVSPNLVVGIYDFRVRITGTENYSGSEDSEVLTIEITRKPITDADFRVSTTSVAKRTGYTDTSYGTITLSSGVTADLNIVNSNVPNNGVNGVSVDVNGDITISRSLPQGTYTFQVRVTGKENYSGSEDTETLNLSVTTNPITDNDFNVSVTEGTKTFGYTDRRYGRVNLGSGVSASYSIVNSNVPNDVVSIAGDGIITVSPNLEVGTYTFQIQLTGTGNYSGSENSDTLTLEITPKAITSADFDVSVTGSTKAYASTDNTYGRVNLSSGVTATYSIANSSVPNDGVEIDATGVITISPSLVRGTYTFQVQVTGTDNYSGSENSRVLNLEITSKQITANDFTIDISESSKVFAYTDTSYGKVNLESGITANLSIINSNFPSGKGASVDSNGDITISPDLDVGTYTFQVRVTGTDNYSGNEDTRLTLQITRKDISDNDFAVAVTEGTKPFGYTDTSYGKINLNPGVFATFFIANIDVPNNGVSVNANNGTITVSPDLAPGTYTFQVLLIGAGNYSGRIETEILTLVIEPKQITRDDFEISIISTIKQVGYTDTSYGKITLDPGVTATFKVFDNNDSRVLGVGVDSEGNITIRTGAISSRYAFSIDVSGTGNYGGTVSTGTLVLTINRRNIAQGDFQINSRVEKEFGYTDESYGQIELNPGVEARFAVPNRSGNDPDIIPIPSNEIQVDSNGNITIPTGLAIGNYDFDIEVQGQGDYTGFEVVTLTLVVTPRTITVNDFTGPAIDRVTRPFYYTAPDDTSYGKITLNSGVTADFAIIDSNVPDDKVSVSADGAITFRENIGPGEYTFKVEVTGKDNYRGSVPTPTLTLVIQEIDSDYLLNTDNTDETQARLQGAYDVVSTEINGTTYVYVTWNDFDSGALTVYRLNADGELTKIRNIFRFDPTFTTALIEQPTKMTIAEIGTSKLLLLGNNVGQSGSLAPGITAFNITAGGLPSSISDLAIYPDDNTTSLRGINGITTQEINGKTFLFVSSLVEEGITVFEVAITGFISRVEINRVANVTGITRPRGMTTVQIGGNTYLYAAYSSGITIYKVNDDGTLTQDSVVPDDGNNLKILGAFDVITKVIGNTTYLFVSGNVDKGVSAFAVQNDGSLTWVASVDDADVIDSQINPRTPALQLDGALGLNVVEVNGTNYLFVAGNVDDGISMIQVAPNGDLIPVDAITNGGNLKLDGARAVSSAVVGGKTFIIVVGRDSNGGISVFEVLK